MARRVLDLSVFGSCQGQRHCRSNLHPEPEGVIPPEQRNIIAYESSSEFRETRARKYRELGSLPELVGGW